MSHLKIYLPLPVRPDKVCSDQFPHQGIRWRCICASRRPDVRQKTCSQTWAGVHTAVWSICGVAFGIRKIDFLLLLRCFTTAGSESTKALCDQAGVTADALRARGEMSTIGQRQQLKGSQRACVRPIMAKSTQSHSKFSRSSGQHMFLQFA